MLVKKKKKKKPPQISNRILLNNLVTELHSVLFIRIYNGRRRRRYLWRLRFQFGSRSFFFYFFLDITKVFDIKIGRRLRRDCSRCTNEKEIKV